MTPPCGPELQPKAGCICNPDGTGGHEATGTVCRYRPLCVVVAEMKPFRRYKDGVGTPR